MKTLSHPLELRRLSRERETLDRLAKTARKEAVAPIWDELRRAAVAKAAGADVTTDPLYAILREREETYGLEPGSVTGKSVPSRERSSDAPQPGPRRTNGRQPDE
jgi:hypothetical protein